MPVYEYRCSAGHFYEKQEGFDAPNQHKCLECGKLARRQLSLPAVIFKGSGFYSTDNRSSSRRSGSSTSSDSAESPSDAPPPSASTENGHSHGPGGHSHDKKPKVEAAID